MNDVKVCTSCGQSAPEARFTGNLRKCNRCRNAAMSPEAKRAASRRYRAKDPEAHNERSRQYRRDNPHMSFYTTSRYLAGLAHETVLRLLDQSNAFERAMQRERDRLTALLAEETAGLTLVAA